MRTLRKALALGAMLIAIAVVTCALGTPAFAADEYANVSNNHITFKTVFTSYPGATTFPKTKFSYAITSGNAVTQTVNGTTMTQIYAGDLANIGFDSTLASNATSTDAWNSPNVAVDTHEDVIDLYFGNFTHAGVYRYVITESALTTEQKSLNITNENGDDSAVTKCLDVYVQNTATSGATPTYNAYAAVLFSPEATPTASFNGGDVTYGYAGKTQQFGHTYAAYTMTLTKVTEGTMADATKVFPFDVSFAAGTANSANDSPNGVTISWAASTAGNTASSSTTVGAAATSGLGGLRNGESVTFTNVPANVVATIREKNLASEGYMVQTSVTGGATLSSGTGTAAAGSSASAATVTMKSDNAADNATVTVTNTLNGISPTGLIFRTAPYLMVLLVSVVLVIVGLVRRNRQSDDD